MSGAGLADSRRLSIDTESADAEAAFRRAVEAAMAGRHGEAVRHYEQALALRPDWFDALNNMAVSLRSDGALERALALLAHITERYPQHEAGHYNRGNALRQAGQLAEALASYRAAAALAPEKAAPRLGAARCLSDLGAPAEALLELRIAQGDDDGSWELWNCLGAVHFELRHFTVATACYERALSCHGADRATILANLGLACGTVGAYDRALEAYGEILAVAPDHVAGLVGLGQSFTSLGQPERARPILEKALAQAPRDVDAHLALARACFLTGDYEAAWPHFEWRWHKPGTPRPSFAMPLWTGQEARDARILIWAEQGFGDIIHFARYLPALAGRFSRVVLSVPPPVGALLADSFPEITVVSKVPATERFDYHCPLLSAPASFVAGPQAAAGPAYLKSASPHALPEALRRASGSLRVGLAWAGNPLHTNDHNRSCPLADLHPLLGLPGVRFFSLQMGPEGAKLAESGAASLVTDLAGQITSFSDSAAIMGALDLVISVDTAVAHLAGALGRPTWLLLPFAPDWRWGLAGHETPWYPTMRLFRQPRPGDWTSVVTALSGALQGLGHRRA